MPRSRPLLAPRPARDGGFTLAEVVVSIAVVTVVMAALTTYFVRTMTVTNQQRAMQVAVQLAADGSELVRAIKGDQLANGRDECSAGKACGAPVAGLDLRSPWRRWDYVAAGAQPTLKFQDTPQVNGVTYNRYWYLVKCWQAANSGTCGSSTSDVEFFRVIIAVTWRDSHCQGRTCAYTTATLVSTASGEPLYPESP
ncbi:prepilin-type N-terminal cleavage/methylation domain-containing protein [Planosporangium flavigriseum]|uniref:Prepilin-type N-terminal cleavage/methylation domain-containing protein n=1 Tax=Planosporangium flavigriseum TaxID=373681 RepID=A0A8J3PP93_9ACTN|nr:prepilin-type N-terminal cleavage/methylation domain-containing protein [Planosporangium flavigriseum]NJC67214.1 prepilin-type N-terminal cleavage/methylation domain-containing protein [Planosporangium flavigriseum]GIG76144.1 hypothetical protein Pfl04_45480 [Planosporangium flavigriseum]